MNRGSLFFIVTIFTVMLLSCVESQSLEGNTEEKTRLDLPYPDTCKKFTYSDLQFLLDTVLNDSIFNLVKVNGKIHLDKSAFSGTGKCVGLKNPNIICHEKKRNGNFVFLADVMPGNCNVGIILDLCINSKQIGFVTYSFDFDLNGMVFPARNVIIEIYGHRLQPQTAR